jgi:hypothetical protein
MIPGGDIGFGVEGGSVSAAVKCGGQKNRVYPDHRLAFQAIIVFVYGLDGYGYGCHYGIEDKPTVVEARLRSDPPLGRGDRLPAWQAADPAVSRPNRLLPPKRCKGSLGVSQCHQQDFTRNAMKRLPRARCF